MRLILDALLVALIATMLAAALFGRLLPMTGHATLVVEGPSMQPGIPVGAAVVADPIAAGELKVGDVVSFRLGGHAIVTHRIDRVVTRAGAMWIETRGDANPSADPALVPGSSVIGRVDLTIPDLGYLIALLSTVVGVVLAVALAGALLAARAFLGTFDASEEHPEIASEALVIGGAASASP